LISHQIIDLHMITLLFCKKAKYTCVTLDIIYYYSNEYILIRTKRNILQHEFDENNSYYFPAFEKKNTKNHLYIYLTVLYRESCCNPPNSLNHKTIRSHKSHAHDGRNCIRIRCVICVRDSHNTEPVSYYKYCNN